MSEIEKLKAPASEGVKVKSEGIKKREFYTQNGWQGNKYQSGRSTVEAAKLIRAEIKRRYPQLRVSVRSEYFSGGSAVRVKIFECGFNPINPKWNPNSYLSEIQNPRFSDEAKALLRELEGIGNQYRYNDSDAGIDYCDTNFFYTVTIDWQCEKRWLEERGIKQ